MALFWWAGFPVFQKSSLDSITNLENSYVLIEYDKEFS
jgi:hypothetical protein